MRKLLPFLAVGFMTFAIAGCEEPFHYIDYTGQGRSGAEGRAALWDCERITFESFGRRPSASEIAAGSLAFLTLTDSCMESRGWGP